MHRIKINAVALLSAILLTVAAILSPVEADDAVPLDSYSVDANAISVSGISSGGFMAVQLHVAYSARYMGAGVVAGGPYFCAEGSVLQAMSACMSGLPLPPSADVLASVTRAVANEGDIDDPSHLADDNVYVFHGLQDDVVRKPVIESLIRYYDHFIDSANLEFVDRINAPHSFVTDNPQSQQCHQQCVPVTNTCFPDSCEPNDVCSFVNDCQYDSAGAILAHIYGELQQGGEAVADNLLTFDQAEFVTGNDPGRYSMADIGHVYVPTDCQSGDVECRLHVAVHGCLQSSERIGDAYYSGAGYNGWAEANNIIVLYPQVVISDFLPLNPQGCWDFWGYSATYYYHKDAPQMAAIDGMVNRLAGLAQSD